jgi:hypothetical protein
MSKSGRPVSLHSAMVIRRAQIERERRMAASAQSQASPQRREGFSLKSIFTWKGVSASNDAQPEEVRNRAA